MSKCKELDISSSSFGSPNFLYGSPGLLEKNSPPSDQIIRGSNLHPRTMGFSVPTKKLCFVPKSKTVGSNKTKQLLKHDNFFNNPLFGRLLSCVPPVELNLNEIDRTEITIPVIEEGVINMLIRLNEIFENMPDMIDFESINDCDIYNKRFDDLCFYNSYQ